MFTDPTIKLRKSENHTVGDAIKGAHNVIVRGRMLVSRTAFVGHSFLPEDKDIVAYVKDLLKEMQVTCSTGEAAEANQVHDKVKRRIRAADFFVGIFTRRQKIEGKEEWTTTEWVQEEMSYAAANDKKIVILKEEGTVRFGGMQGNLEYIGFSRDKLHLIAVKLFQSLWSLNPGEFKFDVNRPPEMSLDVLRTAVDAHPGEPALRVTLASSLRQNGQIKGALNEIDNVLESFPDFASALLEKIEILRALGNRTEAANLCDRLLTAHPFYASAHHSYGHVLCEMGKAKEAEEQFILAADCEPTSSKHLKCHADMLVRTSSRRRSCLERAIGLYQDVQEMSGEKNKEKVAQTIKAIELRIARLPKIQANPKPGTKKTGKRNIR